MDTQAYPLPSSLFPLADALSNGIALHRDGKVLFANKAFSQLTGYAPDDLARLDFWALFPPEVQAQARSHQRSDGVPGATCCEALVHTRKGEARWVELNLSQQAIEGVDTTLCSLLDITDRKRAEEALRQVHADLEAEVGHRTVGARVNGRLVPLESELSNGDVVEILTSNAQRVQPSWVNFVGTAKAKGRSRRQARSQ